jgi:PII-like signaling protein
MSEPTHFDGDAALLRIFIGSRDRHEGRSLFEVIVQEARDAGLAGATVFEGFAGYGANSVVQHATWLRFSQDLPMVVELMDEETKIRAFLPRLEELLSGGGLITLERVTVLHYQPEAGTMPEAEA